MTKFLSASLALLMLAGCGNSRDPEPKRLPPTADDGTGQRVTWPIDGSDASRERLRASCERFFNDRTYDAFFDVRPPARPVVIVINEVVPAEEGRPALVIVRNTTEHDFAYYLHLAADGTVIPPITWSIP